MGITYLNTALLKANALRLIGERYRDATTRREAYTPFAS
jgi:hypothetical protein